MTRLVWSLSLFASVFLAWPQDQDEGKVAPKSTQEGRVEVARLMKTCKKCHLDQWAEWKASRHGKSWTDPVFQAAIKERPDAGDACARCHAPDSLLAKGFGELPAARTDNRELGVNCTTCHNSPTRYFGPFPSEGHGGVLVDTAYLETRICESCHGHPEANEMHEQFASYRQSPAAQAGKRCQDCHMEVVERKMARGRRRLRNVQEARACRTHRFEAAHTTGQAEGAANLALTVTDDQLNIEIRPETGHGFPASEGREVRLRVSFQDAAAEVLGEPRLETFRYRQGMLMPGKKNLVTLEWPESAQSVRAELELAFVIVPGRDKETVLPVASATLTR